MRSLAQFNQQVLECQDDAFTLAWYLLGDEAAAEDAVETAMMMAYHRAQSCQEDGRRLILEKVLCLCAGKFGNRPLETDAACAALHGLPNLERQVIILVDILCLTYTETAELLKRSHSDIIRLLAQARRKIMQTSIEEERGGL